MEKPPVNGIFRKVFPVRPTSRWWVVVPACIGLLIGIPLIVVTFHLTFITSQEIQHLFRTVLGRYFLNTFGLVLVVGVFTGVIGISSAWITTVFDFPGRRVLTWILVIPLSVPTYVAALAYAGIFDFTGPLQLLFREVLGFGIGEYPIVDIKSFFGLCFVLTVTMYPYVYLTSRAVFSSQSSIAMEISRSHGYSKKESFFLVVLPTARPAILAGIILVIMETLGEFGASYYYGIDTLAVGIFRVWFGLGSVSSALSLASLLLLFVGLIMVTERWFRKRAQFYHDLGFVKRPVTRTKLQNSNLVLSLAVCWIPVILGFVLPVGQLLWWLARGTIRAFNIDTFQYVMTSIGLSVVTSLIIIVISVLVAYAARLSYGPVVKKTAFLATSGYSVPPAVLAVGIFATYAWIDHRIVEVFKGLFGFSPGLILTGGLFVLLAGYVVRFFSVGYQTIDSGFSGINSRLDEVSRSCGLRPRESLIRVNLPALKPAYVSAMILLVVDIIKELPLTMILQPFGVKTLATEVFRLAGNEMIPESASLSLLIILIAVFPVIILPTLDGRFGSQRNKL